MYWEKIERKRQPCALKVDLNTDILKSFRFKLNFIKLHQGYYTNSCIQNSTCVLIKENTINAGIRNAGINLFEILAFPAN